MWIFPRWEAVSFLLLVGLSLHTPATLAAPLVDHFSAADGEAYVEAAVRALGDAESSLADKDYAVRLLLALDKPSVASGYKSSACSAASAGLSSGDLEQIHHGISLAHGVGGCANAKTSGASEQVVEAMKRADLRSLYHAALAAPLLGADVSGGNRVLEKVLDLLTSDGSVRSNPSGPVEAGNAFMAAELLAALVPSVNGDAKTIALRKVELMKEKVLGVQPALVVQLDRAAGNGKLVIKAAKLKSMARDLLEASRTSLPKSMLGVYEALKIIDTYPKAPLPIKLSPPSPSVEELLSGDVSLLATSLLGSWTKVISASLSSLARADGSNALGNGGGSSPLGAPNAEGLRALPTVEVAAGIYTAEFAIEVDGGEKVLVAKLPLAVSSAAVLAQARVSVSDSHERPSSFASGADAVSIESYVLAKPGKSSLPDDARASAVDGHHLHVELSLGGASAGGAASPHQVFVRFTHVETGLETFFVAAPVEGGVGEAGEFAVSVSLGEESQTFMQRSGAYEVTALVGGPLVRRAISEKFGVINLEFPAAKERKWPIYARPLLHETDVSLGPLPEKHHTFREPEVRPHAGVSLLFSVLALAPLAGLAHGMRLGGANLRRLPSSGAGRAWCAAYQGCMVGIVLLFVTYWAALTMAYTLRVLALLALATVLTGRKALQSLAVESEGAGGAGHMTDSGSHVKGD